MKKALRLDWLLGSERRSQAVANGLLSQAAEKENSRADCHHGEKRQDGYEVQFELHCEERSISQNGDFVHQPHARGHAQRRSQKHELTHLCCIQRMHVLGVQKVQDEKQQNRQGGEDPFTELSLGGQNSYTPIESQAVANDERQALHHVREIASAAKLDRNAGTKNGDVRLIRLLGYFPNRPLNAETQLLRLTDFAEETTDRRGDLLGNEAKGTNQRMSHPQGSGRNIQSVQELKLKYGGPARNALLQEYEIGR